jgi:hypothetical protein
MTRTATLSSSNRPKHRHRETWSEIRLRPRSYGGAESSSRLLAINDSPVAALNRAIALQHRDGPEWRWRSSIQWPGTFARTTSSTQPEPRCCARWAASARLLTGIAAAHQQSSRAEPPPAPN